MKGPMSLRGDSLLACSTWPLARSAPTCRSTICAASVAHTVAAPPPCHLQQHFSCKGGGGRPCLPTVLVAGRAAWRQIRLLSIGSR